MARITLHSKFLGVILGSLVLFLGIPSYLLIQRENQLLIEKDAEKQHVLISSLSSALQENMIRGIPQSTRALMEDLRGSYGLIRLETLRRDGSPAFNGTGNRYPFPQLKEVFTKGKEVAFQEQGPLPLSTILFPLKNEGHCRRCHSKDEKVLGAVLISLSMADSFREITSNKLNLMMFAGMLIAVLGSIVYLAIRAMVLRPLTVLHHGADSIGKGKLSHRIVLSSSDEFEGLGHAFNEMAGKLEKKYSRFEARYQKWTDQLHESMGEAEERAQQLSFYSRDLATISRLSTSIFTADLSLDDMVDRFMRGLTHGLGYTQVRLCLIDRKKNVLETKREEGMADVLPACNHSLSDGIPLAQLARAGRVVLFDDVTQDAGAAGLCLVDAIQKPLSLAFLPIMSRAFTQRCWEANNCTREDCPAYAVVDQRCWQIPDTRCRNEHVEAFGDKRTYCMTCNLFPVTGVLAVASDSRQRPLRGRNMGVLRILASNMGAAIENHRLHEDNRGLVQNLLELHKVTATALLDLNQDRAISAFLETATGFPGMDECNFWLLSDDESELVRKAGCCSGPDEARSCPDRVPFDQGSLGAAFRENRLVVDYTVRSGDTTGFGKALSDYGMNSLLAIPLSTEGRPVGVFSVYKRSTTPFLETEVAAFMLLANQAAMTFNACRLNEELKNQNLEVSRSMRLTQGILASMSSGVMLLDMDGKVELVNQQGTAILKTSQEAMIGRRLSEMFPEADVFTQGDVDPDQGTIDISVEGGARVPVGYSSAYFLGEHGEHEGVIIIFRDLTEIKALQEELSSKERFATMGRLVAGVAHEIRNPLFGISSIGQIFEKELEQPAHQELVRALLSETKRLNGLVEELLIYGRPKKLELAQCDLRRLWEEVLEIHADELQKRGIRIVGDLHVVYPAAYLDSNQIRQMFFNLLRNSMEAIASEGEITIKLLLEDRYIIFQVIDSGSGISPENIDRIFDLFFTSKPKGTGLGLPICKKIAEDHGGAITASSEEGRGTTVTVKLPYKATE
ncbi:MAG TPA: hypothetical protein DCO77_07870 [Nitrospiraceae bacterium]|nr:hypothetical protein [Nitrospiraceae bacterium]